jgi:hypothetical protein
VFIKTISKKAKLKRSRIIFHEILSISSKGFRPASGVANKMINEKKNYIYTLPYPLMPFDSLPIMKFLQPCTKTLGTATSDIAVNAFRTGT